MTEKEQGAFSEAAAKMQKNGFPVLVKTGVQDRAQLERRYPKGGDGKSTMTTTEAESFWEGLNPRERLLFDLLHTGVASALGGDENRATGIIEKAWKSADRLHPAGVQDALQQVANDQLKRLLKDADRLDFWQAHDWYTGERTADGEWRFFHTEDADGQSCTGASLRDALDELKKVQPDLRGAMDDADAWEG